MSQPPSQLDYASPSGPAPRNPRAKLHFFLGVAGGIAFSVAYYLLIAASSSFVEELYFGAIAIKAATGITLICFRQWRALGIGLIVSIPVAVMIVIGLCFGIIAMSR